MKLRLKGETFIVSWRHDQTFDEEDHLLNAESRVEIANITEPKKVLYRATAAWNPKDPYVKEIARKVSYRRVLQTMDLSYEERAIAWAAYFNRAKVTVEQAA